MCGRFNLRANPRELQDVFDVLRVPETPQRYNIAPTQTILAIRQTDGSREAVSVRWGLIPSWAKDLKIGSSLINARADTVATKPAFRSAFKRRRCLIPASGYYEWRGEKGAKQPFHIHRPDDGLLAFAGMWERWEPPHAEPVESTTIITTDANATLAEVHNRMPVILPPVEFSTWLADDTPREQLELLLRPAAEDLLDFDPIATLVNNVRNEGPDLLAPAPHD
jgi:putative SOS response-associated peptidase YedK